MSRGKRRFDEPGGHLGRNCHRLYLTEDKALGCVTHRMIPRCPHTSCTRVYHIHPIYIPSSLGFIHHQNLQFICSKSWGT